MSRESLEHASGGRYRVVERLGAGSTAEVFLAEEVATRHAWAAKAFRLAHAPDWKAWELVERGARVAASLDHPSLPRFREVLRAEDGLGTLWLVEEYVPGRTLRDLVAAAGPLDVPQALGVVRGLLAPLAYLHGRTPPVIHRDVKPSNAILTPDGRVVLLDLGAVREGLARSTLGGSTVVGTFGYMPPEQLMGRAEPASDLYAVGAVLLYLVTGREPGDFPVRDIRLRFEDALGHRPRLRDLLGALLEPRVERRIPSARHALRAVHAVMAAPSRPAPDPSPAAIGPPPLPAELARFVERFAPAAPVEVQRPPGAGPARILTCPGCGEAMDPVPLGGGPEVDRCPGCQGVWLDRGELNAALAVPTLPLPDVPALRARAAAMWTAPAPVVYRRCPVCDQVMNRVNVARVSGVVADECPRHGLYLDAGEVEQLQAFVRDGGLALARERQAERDRQEAWEQRHRKELDELRAKGAWPWAGRFPLGRPKRR